MRTRKKMNCVDNANWITFDRPWVIRIAILYILNLKKKKIYWCIAQRGYFVFLICVFCHLKKFPLATQCSPTSSSLRGDFFSVPIVLPFPECYVSQIYSLAFSGLVSFTAYCFWDSSVLLHLSILSFFFFFLRGSLYGMEIPQFIFPFADWWTYGLFLVFGGYNKPATDIHIQILG